MNKTELVDAIASSAEITKTQANKALDAFLEAVTDTLNIAQFGRATHLHCVGQRFDPAYLHHYA